MKRFFFIAMVVVLSASFGTDSWRPLQAQDAADCRTPRAACDGFDRFRLNPANSPTWSPQMIRDSGRPIVPVFEGWFQNDDGSYTLSSPVAVGSQLFLRGETHLYCVGTATN